MVFWSPLETIKVKVSSYLECVVGAAVVEVVTEAGHEERQRLQVADDAPAQQVQPVNQLISPEAVSPISVTISLEICSMMSPINVPNIKCDRFFTLIMIPNRRLYVLWNLYSACHGWRDYPTYIFSYSIEVTQFDDHCNFINP